MAKVPKQRREHKEQNMFDRIFNPEARAMGKCTGKKGLHDQGVGGENQRRTQANEEQTKREGNQGKLELAKWQRQEG